MGDTSLKQSTRLIILLFYIVLLIGASLLALGGLPPAPTGKGLWFYTGIVSLILGNLLITPFHTTPKDALANVLLAATALYAVNEWTTWRTLDRTAFLITIIYFVFIALAAITTILTKDSNRPRTQQIANAFKIICAELGHQRFVFTAVILFAIFVFHRTSAKEMLVISLAWIFTVALQPAETFVTLSRKLKNVFRSNLQLKVAGRLLACQTPGLMLIRQEGVDRIPFGVPLVVKDPHEHAKLLLALDYVGRDEGLLLRAIEVGVPTDVAEGSSAVLDLEQEGDVVRISAEAATTSPELTRLLESQKNLVGFVAPDTSMERLYFEVVRDTDLEEGKLVEVAIGERASCSKSSMD